MKAGTKVCRHTNNLPEEKARLLSLNEVKHLQYGNHVYIRGSCNCLLRVKINGKPKLWKRNPDRVEVPWKYGLWEYGYITGSNQVYVERGGLNGNANLP